MCNFTIWADEPLRAIATKVGIQHDARTVLIGSKCGIDRSRGFQSADPRKWRFPIESSTAYTTVPCAKALAREK
jgi:hypothetical protein